MNPVEAYYDANTASFTRTGEGGASIRRAIWAAGVTSREQAFRVVDGRVLEALRSLSPGTRRVLDLGCGVGSSLWWLRQREEFDGMGVTLSVAQAAAASRLFARTTRLTALKASYTELPDVVGHVDLAFAIESFAHSPSVGEFLGPVCARLRPGGKLLVCDDLLGPNHAAHSAVLRDFQWGWVAPTLVSAADLIAHAGSLGLDCVGNEDFTEHLELGRPRDRLLEVVVALGRPLNPKGWLFRSWVGGTALQRGLRARAIEHRLLTFVKR